jgi:biofilm protein TabA
MKKHFILSILLLALAGTSIRIAAQTAVNKPMSKHAAKKWFKKKEWLNGASITPGSSIDYVEFARQYQAHKDLWDKAFLFIKEHDLATMAKGKYPINGTNAFATITEDPSKDFDKTQWESHRKYVDLQYVITGEEKMGQCPVAQAKVTKLYDETKDVANYEATGKIRDVPAGTFMLFFPTDAHRPNITPGGNKVVKKLVIKILAEE